MLYSLFEFGKIAAIGFLLNDYFKRNYPDKHNEIVLDVAYKIIYVYSYCQMQFNTITKKIPFVTNFFQEMFEKTSIKKKSTIDFVKDGHILFDPSSTDLKNVLEHDFIVYTNNQTTPSNIIIVYNTETDVIEETCQYNKTNFKFILLEFCIADKNYIIELANKRYNFYVENNIFDKNFFIYYLRYFHPDKIEIDETSLQMDEFTLKIIDHNVDIKTIYFTKENQHIKLNANSYEII
jgi:hypothetical protein